MIIGLTGGIGSGKSTIANGLAKRGYAVYDCDYWEYADIQKEPLIAQYWDWEQSDKDVPLTISVLNALDMNEASREILNRPLQSAP